MKRINIFIAAIAALVAFFVFSGIASAAVWSSTSTQGQHSFSNTAIVRADGWNCGGGCNMNTWANSASNFGEITNVPAGQTAVLMYPDVQNLVYAPISKYKYMYAKFNQTEPPNGDYEAAFDIWVQDNGNATDWNNDTEVMIWTYNHGQRPAGSVDGTATIMGENFTVWRGGGKGVGGSIYTLVRQGNITSGATHIAATFSWLKQHGYITKNAADLDVEFGWEVCSTGGTSEHFNNNSYSFTKVLA